METTRNPDEARREQEDDRIVEEDLQDQGKEREWQRAAMYLRVATATPDGEEGMEAQRAACLAYAERRELEVVQEFADPGVSAMTLARPGLDALRAAVGRGEFDHVVVASLDRLSRSAADVHLLMNELAAAGSALHSVRDAADLGQAPLMEALAASTDKISLTDAPVVEEVLDDTERDADEQDDEKPSLEAYAFAAFPTWRDLPWRPTTSRRAAVYVRAFPRYEHRDPLVALAYARRICQAEARERGYLLVATIEDWEWGERPERPGLDALRALIRAGIIDVVVIDGPDMLAAHMEDVKTIHAEFAAYGCAINFIRAWWLFPRVSAEKV